MTEAISGGASRKAFDAPVKKLYMLDPITEIRIVGGLVLPEDERGDLDTEEDTSHALHDRRLRKPLKEQFVCGIRELGVKSSITIVKIGDVATVVAGRRRVRALRIVNRERIARGEEPLLIKCDIQRSSSTADLLTSMVVENEGREENDFMTKIANIERLLDAGFTEEQVAVRMNLEVATVKRLVTYADHATDELKQAIQLDRITPSAAGELLGLPAEEQVAKLQEVLRLPEKQRSARGIRKQLGKKRDTLGKRDYKKLRDLVQNQPPGRADKTIGFWEGVDSMLSLILGDGEIDDRLDKLRAKLTENPE